MKVLVTGATGFVGRAVSQALLEQEHEVTAFVRTPSKAKDLEAAGASLAVGDMLEPASYRDLVAEVDVAIHAAQQGVSGRLARKKMSRIRLADELMTETLAQACLAHGKKLIYTSGCFNYGDHGARWITEETPPNPSPLGEGHHAVAARLLGLHKNEGLRVTILAPGFVYGAGGLFKASFYDTMQKGQLRVFGKGENYWSPIHVDDLAQAYVRAAEGAHGGGAHDGETFNIVDDEPLTLRALADALTDAAGKPRVGTIPPLLLKLMIGGPLVNSLVTSFRVKNEKAKQALGWSPQYRSFQDGIPGVLRDLDAQGAAA